jgi:tetratricopeptide (TPR) repeat protein
VELLRPVADQGFPEAENAFAWFLATTQDLNFRDPKAAIRYAETASTQFPNNWEYLSTLAAAYASAGNFERAIDKQQMVVRRLEQDYRRGSYYYYRSPLATADGRLRRYRKHRGVSE